MFSSPGREQVLDLPPTYLLSLIWKLKDYWKNGRSKSWKEKLTKIRDLCHFCKIKVAAVVQKKHAFNNDHQVFSCQPKHPALAFSGPSLGTQSCPFVLTSSNSWEDSRCCRHSSARNLQLKSHVLMPCAAARCRSFKTRSWEASVSSNQVTYDWLFQTKLDKRTKDLTWIDVAFTGWCLKHPFFLLGASSHNTQQKI